MKVTIVEYRSAWQELFEQEKILLNDALKESAAVIEHIGSTSVVGLAAKPVIDIMIGLPEFSMADRLLAKIVALGYEYVPQYEDVMPYRRYFRKKRHEVSTHHIHMVQAGGEFWERHFLFRNYLRENPEAAKEYSSLKKALAAREWDDGNQYADAKTEFIRKIEEKARKQTLTPGPEPPRNLFNEVATLYDEVRPTYPEAIIDATIALAALPSGGKILEIGCGTGQITIPFAARGGYTILALEIGDALAALAAKKCRPYPRVDIVQTSFEAWPVQRQTFDLVLSAQAFHWIAPDYGCAKAAATLKSRGAIALVWNLDVSQHTAFWHATQPIYDAYFPATSAGDNNVSLEEKTSRYKETLCRSDAFVNLHEIRHAWEKAYSGADYLKLLHTYSDHRALPEPDKTRFFQAIAEVIDRAGGVVHRKYETLLLLACKK